MRAKKKLTETSLVNFLIEQWMSGYAVIGRLGDLDRTISPFRPITNRLFVSWIINQPLGDTYKKTYFIICINDIFILHQTSSIYNHVY